ncbi:MAG: transposase [Verrucomicrobiota bacterium]
MRRIKRALLKLSSRYLPKSNLGKAINYAIDQWSGLELYLQNGAIEIDNNLVENAIRPIKLGMKNWLFLGSEASGQISAILFTVIESAKRHSLKPYEYVRHLLETLPSTTNWNLHKLTPRAKLSAAGPRICSYRKLEAGTLEASVLLQRSES